MIWMRPLITKFEHRCSLIRYVQGLSGLAEDRVSSIQGGGAPAWQKAELIDPAAYSRNRNYLKGAVSGLSPYIRHGVMSPAELADQLAVSYPSALRARFVQQLAWRDYFHRVHQAQSSAVWQDREAYKTGFSAQDYADHLPEDILQAQTGVRLVDQLIEQLLNQGYLHNHARLYLASYIVHWRRIKWQAGAAWFLSHLLDGDIASNNYSWQWVASTFSAKPYIFNLDNVKRFAGDLLDCTHPSNRLFDASYERLTVQLFPNRVWEG